MVKVLIFLLLILQIFCKSNDESRYLASIVLGGSEDELMLLSESEDVIISEGLLKWGDVVLYMKDVKAHKRVEQSATGLPCTRFYEYDRRYDVLDFNTCWMSMAYSVVCRHGNDSFNYYKTWHTDGIHICPHGLGLKNYSVSRLETYYKITNGSISINTGKVAGSWISTPELIAYAAVFIISFLSVAVFFCLRDKWIRKVSGRKGATIGFVYPQEEPEPDFPKLEEPSISAKMMKATQVLAGKPDEELEKLKIQVYELNKEKVALQREIDQFKQQVLDRVSRVSSAKDRAKRDTFKEGKGEVKMSEEVSEELFEDVESLEELFKEIPHKEIKTATKHCQTDADETDCSKFEYKGAIYLVPNSLFNKAASFEDIFEEYEKYIDDGEDPDSSEDGGSGESNSDDADDDESDSDDGLKDDYIVKDNPERQFLKHVKLIHATRCVQWVRMKRKEKDWNSEVELSEWKRMFKLQNTMFDGMAKSSLMRYIENEEVFPVPDLNGYFNRRVGKYDSVDFHDLRAYTVVTPKTLLTAGNDKDRMSYIRDIIGEACGIMQRGTKSKICNRLLNIMMDLNNEMGVK